jgi:phosphatidylglycerol:prolipoprotein diacylglycerol transferase
MSLPVHPTQIYAAIAGFLVLAFLLAYIPYRRRHGELIALLMISYGLSRWPIEMMRGDERPILAGMTLSQTISAILIAAGTGLWLARRASRTQPALRGSHQRMAIRATVPDCPISR